MNDDRRDRVERLLAEYLVSLETEGRDRLDELLDFDAFASRHEDVEDELRESYRAWLGTAGLLEALEIERGRAASRGASRSADPAETRDDASAGDVYVEARKSGAGRYRVTEELARGGQGAVFRVHDTELGRDLAMKRILPVGSGSSRTAAPTRKLGRFLEEARVTGRLEHPGIVPVHELGIDAEGGVFFTMKLVDGCDFEEVIELAGSGRDGWSQIRALDVILKVCEAMAYAHSKGVVHRDLKPRNVMVGPFGEVYVMDWGLAKVLGEPEPSREAAASAEADGDTTALTLDGDVIGTPAYMSPEQALGRWDEVGPATDVYSVGAMLYHLLAGHAPYVDEKDSPDPRALLLRLGIGEPKPLSRSRPELPSELVAVCEKAMAREASERYAGMRALADDLRAFLEGRVVRAYETGAWAEARKWVRRNRALAAAIAGTAVVLVVGLVVVGQVQAAGRRAADRERRVAERNAEEASFHAELAQRRADELAAERQVAEEARQASERVADFLVEQFEDLELATNEGRSVDVGYLLDRASRSLERGFGERSPEGARLGQVLGNAYRALGRHAEAETLLVRTEATLRELYGPVHPITFEAKGNLVELYRRQGRHDVAEGLAEATLELAESEGDASSEVRSLVHLAGLRIDQARYGDAHELVAAALEKSEDLPARGAAESLELRNLLGSLYRFEGRYPEAAEVFREALADSAEELGEEHPHTLLAMNNLAVVYLNQERLREAYELLAVVVERRTAVLGEDHPHTLASANNLGNLLKKLGRFGEAADLLARTVERLEAVLGPDHLDTLAGQENLAGAYCSLGRLDEAEELYLLSHEKRAARLGPEHPDVIASLNNLGGLYGERGRYADAESAYLEALRRLERTLGVDHPRARLAMRNLQGLYRSWIHRLVARGDENDPELIEVRSRFAAFHHDVGRPDRAEPLLLDCLDRRLATLGVEDPATLQSFHDLGCFYAERGRPEEADPLLWECYRTRRDVLGDGAPPTLDTLEAIVLLYKGEGRWSEAVPLAERLARSTEEGSARRGDRRRLLAEVRARAGD